MKNKDLVCITQMAMVELLNKNKWEIIETFYSLATEEELTPSVKISEIEEVLSDSIEQIKYLFNQF